MKNDFAHARKEFTDFDYFPNPLKEILQHWWIEQAKLAKFI